jgi:hypothetical protein
MCSDIREGETFPELQRRLVLGRPTMAELHVEPRGVFKGKPARLRLGGSGVEGGAGTRRPGSIPRRHIGEPIRYAEGESIGIKRQPWERAARPRSGS